MSRTASAGWIVVFARQPRPGAVKTRLTPPFTPDEAARFYEAMLSDVLELTARAASALGLRPVLAVDPPAARAQMASRAPASFCVIAQHGGDLGARMARAVDEGAAAGASPILLRGSDSPALADETLAAARAALERSDLVVCPDRDGGYNLIGLRHPVPGLFRHPMSTASVLRDTLANAAAAGLSHVVLEPGFDIDVASDLRWLADAREASTPRCPRTLAYLDAQDLWRHAGRVARGSGSRSRSDEA
ncbi:MAG: TIGR04282 family arsenosugar biosynthesis glycosyltransferase [Deltaproteobacteria bacterium]|nr:MAG: TIGR04282 family arsenosugar biosynthesis glycosyltransferase [Deltaproteobacteria bacterium]